MNSITSNRIDDLLLNSDVFSNTINENIVQHNFCNETILITGAAGSIGSGLVKQLIHSTFKKLILVDIAESPLYNLIKSLENTNTRKVEFFILNITNKSGLVNLFKKYKPTIIFHAAAYKHVPLMENNPLEAIHLNIFGTQLLADLAVDFKVKKFVFISTDKAVNPISIMGFTKLIAENYLKYISENKNTNFYITRFGNVLGSNGSVVPVFKKQIESGLPLTITNEEITRYFIQKETACELILKIALTEESSNSFTFNMGEPIKILDLAKRMIHLSKLNKNYPIKFTSLRPGEKLTEEIISNSENLIPTKNPDIFIIENLKTALKPIDFLKLKQLDSNFSVQEIKTILKNTI
ncbi:SDR family NAD(P)-dependent oxidoreductase [Neotamlana sedimentorum]|uniref:SDR family NAD(P)-dependent oxidoreductase n=1 Tax=Neotamlana sedimentorum TaxID=1435349 RepID=UPI00069BCC40|nr:SDR family NAD(P)-dependent oxidoreductase [Tamlana sedimentorum]